MDENNPTPTPQAAFEFARVIQEPLAQHNLSQAESGAIINATGAGGCAFTIPVGLLDGFNVAIFSVNGDSSLNAATGVFLNGVTAGRATVKKGYGGVTLVALELNKIAASGNVGP